MLDFKDFLHVVENAPLISIDLIVQNENGEFLLGKRLNPPAKGDWFVPGGRIYKNETLDQAFVRIAKAELGIELARQYAPLLGVYEHFYDTNAGEQPGFGTHYVVLAHQLAVQQQNLCLPVQDQHQSWCWLSAEAIRNEALVNQYSRQYF